MILHCDAATKLFLLGLCFPVMSCFVRGKWSSQVADEIPQVFRKVLRAHFIEVIAPLFIRHDHKAQHFFSGQLDSVLRFLRSASIFPVNVCEIPLTGSKKPIPKCLIVQVQGNRSPLDARYWCYVQALLSVA